MTDARHPERWLNDRRIQQLSSEAFFAFSNALLWSVSNRTDGVIKFADLELIPRCKSGDADELVESKLWKQQRDGWLILDYRATQRSRKQLESDDKYRERERDRVARVRAYEREQSQVSEFDDLNVRTDVRAYERTDHIGQGFTQDASKKKPTSYATNYVSVDDAIDNPSSREFGDWFAAGADYEPPSIDADGFPLDVR
ncbi:hypothetical protein [Mycobacterium sp.]|uniref:hypothetical protein n=1 Tax=Mycobacterium sp. TaxID=1785 RepID=UPI003BB02FD6